MGFIYWTCLGSLFLHLNLSYLILNLLSVRFQILCCLNFNYSFCGATDTHFTALGCAYLGEHVLNISVKSMAVTAGAECTEGTLQTVFARAHAWAAPGIAI